jgi:hypothetical protein
MVVEDFLGLRDESQMTSFGLGPRRHVRRLPGMGEISCVPASVNLFSIPCDYESVGGDLGLEYWQDLMTQTQPKCAVPESSNDFRGQWHKGFS